MLGYQDVTGGARQILLFSACSVGILFPCFSGSTKELPTNDSLSHGHPWNGSLERGVSICPQNGTLFHAFSCRRGLHWGTQGLVDVLADTSRKLKRRFPDLIMPVGNLSAREGGKIASSVSHQSGRDADIGFIIRDRNGRQVLPLPLYRIRNGGKHHGSVLNARRKAKFDVAANWTMIRALLSNPRVQWIFIADFLKQDLLDWRKAITNRSTSLKRPNGFSTNR